MANLTLVIPDEVLKSARKLAIDRDTSVNQLVRDYLEQLTQTDKNRQKTRRKLIAMMDKGICEVGEIRWKREDLYER